MPELKLKLLQNWNTIYNNTKKDGNITRIKDIF